MISFSDWVSLHVKESSAQTRLRYDAALGLKPPIPDASIHSHNTATPWQIPKLKKKRKKKKKSTR
jgi:hypothetical protein